jgi:hypothetical protein
MPENTASPLQTLERDWQAANDALAMAEAALGVAVHDFRSTGDDECVRGALLARTRANAKLRAVMHKVWSAPA